ncbi:MAG: glycerate kinase type-2 family protein, partial [Vicinamibacteria bacterium]
DKIATTELLIRSGADIRELNAIRKHLSDVKGGRLAERMSPASVIGLVVSDVIGNDLSAIGSGPLVADPTTFSDALEIVLRRGLDAKLPRTVLERLRAGARGDLPETPKPGDPLLEKMRHVVLASNRISLSAAREKATALRFEIEVYRSDMEGEVHETALGFSERLAILARGARPAALLAGGELTLRVKGSGLGGRSQEFALEAARQLKGIADVVVLAAGTDGTDGPTDAAGAFGDGGTWERARSRGLDPDAALADNDSYRLFDALGDLLRTGPTGTNVNDIVIGLTGSG